MKRASHFRGILGALLPLATVWTGTVQAQRNFSLTVVSTNQSIIQNAIVISWQAQSATPIGDLELVPEFQVERSTDLGIWEPVGDLI